MCGIAGIIASRAVIDRGPIDAMVGALRHRGPDDSGIDSVGAGDAQIWLGNTRLAIIDLSSAGHMPMADTGSSNLIVYNGEVYNFQALRPELECRGDSFRSRTDTEVVLHLYRQEGVHCVERMRGMFSFAIWDAARRELFLARDRAGLKPLYYCTPSPGLFLFASEVRALLASGLVEPRLDEAGLEIFLSNGFLVSPLTLVRGVRSLLPGHWMRVGPDGTIRDQAAYWSPPRPCEPCGREITSRLDEMRSAFQEAVTLRLISDVPLGVFLSGGLDSSSLAAALKRSGADVRTFSVAFADPRLDESRYSRRVAASLGTSHTEVKVSEEQFWGWMPDALAAIDQPTFDGVNTYLVARAAREAGLKVALSGLGADELFGGYPFFRSVPMMDRLARLVGRSPRATRAWGRSMLRRLPATTMISGPRKALDLVEMADDRPTPPRGHPVASYQVAQILFPSWSRRRLLDPDAHDPSQEAAPEHTLGLPEEFVALLRTEMEGFDGASALSLLAWRLFLGERCLRDTDSMSMGVSMEVRAPFTDHLFVEQVMRLPGRLRCEGSPDKPFERRLLEPSLAGAWEPRPKQGFILPFREWIGAPSGRTAMERALHDAPALRDLGLRPEGVAEIWKAHRDDSSRVPWSRVWALFVLSDWCRRHRVSL